MNDEQRSFKFVLALELMTMQSEVIVTIVYIFISMCTEQQIDLIVDSDGADERLDFLLRQRVQIVYISGVAVPLAVAVQVLFLRDIESYTDGGDTGYCVFLVIILALHNALNLEFFFRKKINESHLDFSKSFIANYHFVFYGTYAVLPIVVVCINVFKLIKSD